MSIQFPQTEEEILRYWKDIDGFQTQLKLTEDQPRFTFYDGPPFATGLPHYGHLLTSTIKDIIPRYWSMKGYHVSRRFGWDTHGLPIEYEIDKKLGISGRDAVMQMGVEAYNAECRAIVMRFSTEWRHTIERLGRWIDFDNDYKSMDVTFMESCWFESGSMPYASNHFPFENPDKFHGSLFPADFIAEGLDQTRGWFYTLTVLGNHLFNKSPFNNVIVNGIVLAEDGKKMSKSLKNYPDPNVILQAYGSDALRLYLINSPVVRAESIRFKESGVKEIVSRVLLPLWNCYRFFSEQAMLYKRTTGQEFIAQASFGSAGLSNVMDRWILADCQSLLKFMDREMIGYRLYTVVPRLLQVLDNLTNWYIRFNRKRLKGVAGLGTDDTTAALNTLIQVLFTMVRALAPFIPFITEHIYRSLRCQLVDVVASYKDTRSVHFLPFPTVQEALFDQVIERQVSAMQKVIQLGRVARERRTLSLKTPLQSLVVIADKQILSDIKSLESYILEELNVREIILTEDEQQYNVLLEAKVDWPTLGKKLKKSVQVVRRALPNLTQEQLRDYQREKKITLDGIELEENDLTLVRVMGSNNDGASQWEPAFTEDIVILLDTTSHAELYDDGLARELINRVQKLRKKAGLMPTDDIQAQYSVVSNPEGVPINEVVSSRQETFVAAFRGTLEVTSEGLPSADVIVEEEQNVGGLVLNLRLLKLH